MRLRDLRLEAESEGFRASVHVEGAGPAGELWYEVRGTTTIPEPGMASAAFAAACLPHAVFWEEDLQIDDPVDADFLFRLPALARAHARLHGRKKITLVQATGIASLPHSPGAVGMSFTGGVDSFYTLWSHRNAEGATPIGAIVTGLGLDTRVDDREAHRELGESLQRVAEECGLRRFTVRTNFREFFDPYSCPSLVTQGACLVAFAFLLSGELHTYLIPSSQPIDRLYPYSSHALLDGAWIAGPTRTVSHGWDIHRNDKLAKIVEWPLALQALRVCQIGRGVTNCGRCEKCVRTMALLRLNGVRQVAAFPHPLEARHVESLRIHHPQKLYWWGLIRKAASENPELSWLDAAIGRWMRKVRLKMPFRQRRMRARALRRWPLRRFD